MNKFKEIAIKTPILRNISEYINKIRLTGTIRVGLLSQEEKAKLILEYAKRYNCKTFIETGTYKGDTINACKDFFDELFSIELGHDLFVTSKIRFSNIEKIHILEGNSGDILPQITKKNSPTLFWLDAHYSGGETAQGPEDSPIIKELDFILENNFEGCILIDDARCFNGKAGYPKIKMLREILANKNKNGSNDLEINVRNDIIRITRKI